jgi:hypothetical protein
MSTRRRRFGEKVKLKYPRQKISWANELQSVDSSLKCSKIVGQKMRRAKVPQPDEINEIKKQKICRPKVVQPSVNSRQKISRVNAPQPEYTIIINYGEIPPPPEMLQKLQEEGAPVPPQAQEEEKPEGEHQPSQIKLLRSPKFTLNMNPSHPEEKNLQEEVPVPPPDETNSPMSEWDLNWLKVLEERKREKEGEEKSREEKIERAWKMTRSWELLRLCREYIREVDRRKREEKKRNG